MRTWSSSMLSGAIRTVVRWLVKRVFPWRPLALARVLRGIADTLTVMFYTLFLRGIELR